MRSLIFAAFFATICTCKVYSQRPSSITPESVYKTYNDSTIHLTTVGKYIKSDVEYPLGLGFYRLKKEIKKSPDAFEAYKHYRGKIWRGNALVIASVAGFITVVSLAPSPVALVFMIPYTAGVLDVATAGTHLHRAVWLYNRDQLIKGLQK